MEVTPEMIEAVRLHNAKREKIRQDQEQERRLARYRQQEQVLTDEMRAEVRKIAPDLTDAQISELSDTFDTYHDALSNIW